MLLLILMAVPVLADQYAVTNDGKTVQLKDDGTWEYTEEGERKIAEERKEFWTDIVTILVKVLGIVAALIILRYVIQVVGKVAVPKQQNEHKKTED